MRELYARQQIISTHAPAGGATFQLLYNVPVGLLISTHAPAGGATLAAKVVFCLVLYFYSRPCGRGDKYSRC